MARNEPSLGNLSEDPVNPSMHSAVLPERSQKQAHRRGEEVIVVDIRMPFWSMVIFMVKWAIAAIPALLILMFFFAMMTAILGGFLSHTPLSPH